MHLPLLYIGPGLGLGTIVIVLVVLLIIFGSIAMIIWTPIKNFFRRFSRARNKK